MPRNSARGTDALARLVVGQGAFAGRPIRSLVGEAPAEPHVAPTGEGAIFQFVLLVEVSGRNANLNLSATLVAQSFECRVVFTHDEVNDARLDLRDLILGPPLIDIDVVHLRFTVNEVTDVVNELGIQIGHMSLPFRRSSMGVPSMLIAILSYK